MDVGNDPFPREEVTGLAAFENLEPGSTVSVIPEDLETPPPSPLPAPTPGAARARSMTPPPIPGRPPEPPEYDVDPAPIAPVVPQRRSRADSTMPLNLSAPPPPPAPDDQFDASSWEDPDEARTRVANVDPDPDATPSPLNRDPSFDFAGRPAAALDMDWDEEEPPTRMRGDSMLNMPPLSFPEAEEGFEPNQGPASSGFYASTVTMTGGRPSPFPPAPQRLLARSEALGAPSPFSARALPEPEEKRATGFVDRLRAGDRPAWLWLGGTANGLIALALLVRAFIGSAAAGTVTLTTTPSDASVLIDGRQLAGTSSPYSLSDVAPGQHELTVRKAGFVDYRATFTLARAENKTLPAVELVANVQEVGFSIRSAPAGAEVWVDGRPTDELTPARVTGVTPGIHRLQLKRSGYADYELQLFVPEGTLLQLPTADLVAASSAAAPEKREREREPREAKVAHERAAKDDSPSSGSEKRASRASRRSSSAPAPAAPRAPSYAQRSPAPPPQQQPMAAPVSAAAGGKSGTLRLNSRPWAQVIVDGRVVGNTPQPALQLPAGNHKVQLINPQMGLTKNFSVSIKSGQVVTKVMNLAE